MQVEQLLKKGNAALLLEWIEKYADEEYASLLDETEEITRKNLNLR